MGKPGLYFVEKNRSAAILGGTLLATAGLSIALVGASIFNVEGGHRAVMYSRISGVKDKVYNEGTHFRIPWVETPHIYDVRAKPHPVSSLTGTKDLQMVNISVRVLSRARADKLPEIHKTLGPNYDQKVLPSIVNEVLKSVVAKFNATQLITQRDHVSKEVRKHMITRASYFNLLLDDVSLTHLTFSPEFTHAVEAKQIAQQEAQRAGYLVERAIQEKQRTIVQAEGESRSAELVGAAIKKCPEFLELRMADAAVEMSQLISGSSNGAILNADLLMFGQLSPK